MLSASTKTQVLLGENLELGVCAQIFGFQRLRILELQFLIGNAQNSNDPEALLYERLLIRELEHL